MSRRRRSIIIGLCLLLGLVSVIVDRSFIGRQLRSKALPQEQTQAGDLARYNGKTFVVIRVVDGDTLDIDVPDGLEEHTRIRLWGVDTPETAHSSTGAAYFGEEASAFATGLALGKQVTIYLEEDRRTRDKYDRLLAYVQLPDGKFLNEVLLEEGYAYADSRFKHSFYNKYKQLESAARIGQKGLWLKVTPDQMPKWRREKSKSQDVNDN